MQTLKLKYHTLSSDDLNVIKSYQVSYNNVLHWMYNRVVENTTEKQREQQAKSLNNIDNLDSWFIRSASKHAMWINEANKNNKVIFGGKRNFIRRCKGIISKEEYQAKRLLPLQSVGEAQQKANRKFRISTDIDKVVFSPNRNVHIDIIFDGVSNNYKKILTKLYILQESKSLPISYQLSQDYIYIMFDEKELYTVKEYKHIKDRVMAIDINPNYIGWSIVDWKSSSDYTLVKHGVFNIKPINDKENALVNEHVTSEDKRKIYLNNKRKHEVMEIGKNLINKAIYYKCDSFAVEDITMSSSDKERGKRFNRLVNNQWCRVKFLQNIEKRCNIFGIKLIKVKPEYSSFVGNIVFRGLRLADMELSSIEIGRRGYEFRKQYIDKIERQRNNIIVPDVADYIDKITQSLEELGVDSVCENLRELYYELKKAKCRYRLSLDEVTHPMFSRCFSKASLILKYNN